MLIRQSTQRAWKRSAMRLVFDFDGTITRKDTIGELAHAAIKLQKQRTKRDLQPAWDNAVQEYLKDYGSYKKNYSPSETGRLTLDEETKFLAGLKDAEEASLSRVSETGIFAGLSKEDLFQIGVEAASSGRTQITDGFYELVDKAALIGHTVDVLSVNWSASFIRGVLHQQPNMHVMANEISENGHIQGPEPMGSRIKTAPDKLEALSRILTSYGSQGEEDKVLYFGDSTTDLQCLLLARGVVVAQEETSSSLLETLSRVGIRVAHIQDKGDAKLVWAKNFRDVLQSGVLEQRAGQ